MEISANELFVLIILAIVCWKLREALDEVERRTKQQFHSPAPAAKSGRGDHALAGGASSPSNADGIPDGGVSGRLRDIERVDRSFNTTWFIDNANIAYEKIIAAFAQSDRELLRTLLTDDVYEAFVREIDDRESRDEHLELSFIRLKRSEIVDAGISQGRPQIVVSFDSELVMATRNSAGLVVAGQPAKVINALDLWTFVKTSPASPIWQVARTESPAGKKVDPSQQ
jgi:predicted lipid-binding transport protein (Tim44 family)